MLRLGCRSYRESVSPSHNLSTWWTFSAAASGRLPPLTQAQCVATEFVHRYTPKASYSWMKQQPHPSRAKMQTVKLSMPQYDWGQHTVRTFFGQFSVIQHCGVWFFVSGNDAELSHLKCLHGAKPGSKKWKIKWITVTSDTATTFQKRTLAAMFFTQ